MKNFISKHVLQSLAVVASSMLSSSVYADFNFGSLGLTSITAWSTASGTTASPSTGTTFATATLSNCGTAGTCVVNQNENANDTGPHAADNHYGTDMYLLSFSSAVNLTGVGIGWSGSDNKVLLVPGDVGYVAGQVKYTTLNQDSDFSVLAYTGSGTGVGIVSGKTEAGLLTSSWKLISNYADTATNGAVAVGAKNSDQSALYSSYWLVSAYSTAFGGALTAGDDYFKLLSVAGNTCNTSVANNKCGSGKVPEPGSLALLGAGLLGLVASRRRQQKAV